MKLEVIKNCTTEKIIKVYSVPDLAMLDFQEWHGKNEDVIKLNQLSHTIANLNSTDSEINEPISNLWEVDFYLPDPIKNRALSQFMKSQTNTQKSSDQIPNEAADRGSMAVLKSSTVLSAVVTKILQNHHPHSDYKVRISDE